MVGVPIGMTALATILAVCAPSGVVAVNIAGPRTTPQNVKEGDIVEGISERWSACDFLPQYARLQSLRWCTEATLGTGLLVYVTVSHLYMTTTPAPSL